MRGRRFQPKPLYASLLATVGATFAAAACALAILMLTNLIGPFQFSEAGREPQREAVALWHGNLSHSQYAEPRVQAWREIAPDGLPFLESGDLRELVDRRVGTIVVANARSISIAELAMLRRFVEEGGGALITGAIAVRDSDGDWRGWSTMAEFLGTGKIDPLPRQASSTLVAWRRGPLTAGLMPGERISLVPEPGVPAIHDPDAELRWYPGSGAGAGAAAMRVELGLGRMLWLAAGPASRLDGGNEAYRPMTRLLHAGLAWVGRQPVLEILPWPSGAPFAATWSDTAGERGPNTIAAAQFRQSLEASADRAEATAGRAILPHPDLLDPALRSSLQDFATELLRRRHSWVASENEVANWSRLRAGIAARFELVGPRRLLVHVTNSGYGPADHVALRVHLNRPLSAAGISSTKLFEGLSALELRPRMPRLQFESNKEWVDLHLPSFPAGANRSYALDYEPLRVLQPQSASDEGV